MSDRCNTRKTVQKIDLTRYRRSAYGIHSRARGISSRRMPVSHEPGAIRRSSDLESTRARMPVKGHEDLPSGGHENCPLVATRSARSWPTKRAWWWLGQGVHPLAGHGLGESHAVAGGLADVGVVQEPVDGGGGQRLGHELVESGRVQVAA